MAFEPLAGLIHPLMGLLPPKVTPPQPHWCVLMDHLVPAWLEPSIQIELLMENQCLSFRPSKRTKTQNRGDATMAETCVL